MKKFIILTTLLFLILSLISVLISSRAYAAKIINFRLDRNRIIIPTVINGSRELNLILDTGMPFDGVYLFHKELNDEIKLENTINVHVPGAGDGEASEAIMADSQIVSCGEMNFNNQRVIIAQSATTQSFPTDGVVGQTILGHYIIKIDFDSLKMTLFEPKTFIPDSSWFIINLEYKKGIPFLKAEVEVIKGEKVAIDIYMDISAGEPLELLVKDHAKFTVPDNLEQKYLGTGLSGDIHGGIARIHSFSLGPYTLYDLPATFPPAEVRSKQEGADGILGNDALRRFNVVIDPFGRKLFIRPNQSFKTPFE
ncbi:MAG: hypothetical protein ABIJ45_06250 [Candidatus Zixiibacteriota bacterium]